MGILVSDDFSGGIGGWTFTDSLADCSVAATGGGTADAFAEFTLPSGTAHAIGGLTCPRLMKAATDADGQVVLALGEALNVNGESIGLLFYEDANNWVACNLYRTFGNINCYRESQLAGVNGNTYNENNIGSVTHFRMTRTGNSWQFATSSDGSSFTNRGGSFTAAITIATAGFFAQNFDAGAGVPAGLVKVDYIEDQDDTISPEDPVGGASTFAYHWDRYPTVVI